MRHACSTSEETNLRISNSSTAGNIRKHLDDSAQLCKGLFQFEEATQTGILLTRARASPIGRYFSLTAIIVSLSCLLGCSGLSTGAQAPVQPSVVASVSVSPTSAQISTSQTQQFGGTAKDSSGNAISGNSFTWSSDAPSVVSVNGSGLASGLSAGIAHVIATAPNGASGFATLAVQAPAQPPVVATVSVSPASAQTSVGQTQQFSATAQDGNGNLISGVSFTWSSDATSVATVSATGLAAGVSPSTAHITATAQGVSGSADLTVVPPALNIQTVTLPNATIGLRYSFQLSAVGGRLPYQWSVSAGALPSGIQLDASTGEIGGQASSLGSFPFTVEVIDAQAQGATTEFTLVVGEAPAGTVPATLFGLHYQARSGNCSSAGNPFPSVPFGGLRLWDSCTRWQQIEPSSGTYSFASLDAYLNIAKINNFSDVLLTLSATPTWISSDASNSTCDYAYTGKGSCGVPADIALSCTNTNGLNNCDGQTDGSNQQWKNFVYHLGSHIAGLSPSSYATVSTFEIWNEFTRRGSWEGTAAQLVFMAQTANCILTGRGVIIAQGNAACNASNMGVPGVGVLASAQITTPDAMMTLPDSTTWGNYLTTPGAVNAADLAAVHAYTQNGSCCALGETVATRYSTAAARMSVAGGKQRIWSTEGSWGYSTPNDPDPDLQAAFVARYYLMGWSAGFQRLYWYAYDNPSFGTLWNKNGVNGCNDGGSGLGCLTKAGQAYQQVYSWIVGATISTPCSLSGTVYTCGFTLSTGPAELAVWDTSQSCSGGSCTTSTYTYDPQYTTYYTLANGTTTALSGGTVQIGAKPILLSQ